MLNKIINRPISPHLTVYSPEVASVFSIWHRITGVVLSLSLVTALVLSKNFVWLNFNPLFISIVNLGLNLVPWLVNFVLASLYLFLYHMLNGSRHITWDLGFSLKISNINFTAWLIMLALVFSLVLYFLNS
uniref:Succinate:cytochrome c oxidoreductase subunit 3 n=1 Tax=Ahnfeltia plicata TaxID=28023 RepID=A0A0A7A789_9FLOR|nr:succinate:cytochrome c oxidoreductase subunit 3 [Ahnfeltia plicata]AHB62112.1 succinate:cytochrome c oxidoreductase subunit 3 [Ahnfeltia plicata]